MPKLSVTLPTIGREFYLKKAIQSLLDQTIPFDEVIVYDNSVGQNLDQFIINEFPNSPVKIIKSGSQLNPLSSWTNAVNACSNDHVLIFGDDDEADSILHEVIQKYLATSNFIMVSFNRINEKSEFVSPANNTNLGVLDFNGFIKGRIDQRIDMMIPGIVFLKEHFIKAGGFMNSGLSKYLYSDDLLWFKIGALNGDVLFTKETAWNYRVHSSQIGHNVNLFEFNKAVPLFVDKVESEIQRVKGGADFDLLSGVGINKQEYTDRLILTRYNITTNKFSFGYKKIKCITAVLLSSLSFSKKRAFIKSVIKSLIK